MFDDTLKRQYIYRCIIMFFHTFSGINIKIFVYYMYPCWYTDLLLVCLMSVYNTDLLVVCLMSVNNRDLLVVRLMSVYNTDLLVVCLMSVYNRDLLVVSLMSVYNTDLHGSEFDVSVQGLCSQCVKDYY